MATIIEKLQQAALDSKAPVSDLLRRVKYVAAKLGLGSVEDWVEQELNGYQTRPPDYRLVHGRPMARNPVRGWMPIGGATEPLSSMMAYEAVSALEALVASTQDGGSLHKGFPDKIQEALDRQNGVRGWNYALEIPPSEMARILDRVRTLVLDWALNLEKAGIMGTEDNFDSTEKQKAHAFGTTIHIEHIGSFVGNLGQGNASGDIDASGIRADQLTSVVSQLRAHHSELMETGADGKRLQETLTALEAALAKKDHGLIRGLLVDLRNTLSGAAGSLIATGAINVLNTMLGTGIPPT